MKKHVAGTENGGGGVVHYATHFTPTISRLWFHELITCTANDGVKEEISIIKKILFCACIYLNVDPSC